MARRDSWLVMPAVAVVAMLLVAPLVLVGDESLRVFVPGRVGSVHDAPLTLQNYGEIVRPAYARYFADTFRLSLVATLLALALAYPIGYRVAREARPRVRRTWIAFLVVMLFLSILIRVYAVSLAVGPTGFGAELSGWLGLSLNSRGYAELSIVLGLLHCLIPMAAIVLLAPLQAQNPRLVEAARALGAPAWKAHATVTLPLSARGVLAAFMLCFTFSISAFVIPLVLGKGRVLFVSNLIYSRFGEVGNYPSGAALSIALLSLSLIVVYALGRAAGGAWDRW
ncbi:MAG TPA: ABC transporter permease subunit [Casimicrobiaceae bacterium]|nr:ABC transporter permease subunit [Casimicrobiaceae bacterium]